MSFILDALRKAERERHLGQPPKLEDLASPPPGGAPRGRWRTPASITIAALLIVALFLFLFWRRPAPPVPVATRESAAVTPAPAVTALPTESAPAEPSAPASAAASEAEEPTIEAGEEIATLDDLLETEPLPVSEPPPKPEPSRLPPEPIAKAATEPPASLSLELSPVPLPRTRVETLRLEAAPAPGVPTFRDMPAAFRADFPALTIDVHAWNPDPARRFVLINGLRYHEGDPLPSGLRIVEIAHAGVVFEYRGQRTLYPLN